MVVLKTTGPSSKTTGPISVFNASSAPARPSRFFSTRVASSESERLPYRDASSLRMRTKFDFSETRMVTAFCLPKRQKPPTTS